MEKLPYIDPSLVDYLLKVYPLKVIQPGTPSDQIFFESGQRSVVEMLVSRLQEQEADAT